MAALSNSTRHLIAPTETRTASRAETADPRVVRGIREAARATNVDFGYLMAQAVQESGLNPDAKSSTSSAAGLFQFVERTWLDMMRKHGAKYGVGELARQISSDGAGRPTVSDPELRRRILDLRSDPTLSAALAAEYARGNKDELERALGRSARSTDLYLAHFLGPGGATEFLRLIERNGSARAADLLPEAAAANRGVFYDRRTGEKRTVAEIYRNFAEKMETGAAGGAGTDGDDLSIDRADRPSGIAAAARRLGIPDRVSEPLSAMLNVITLAAMKLVGSEEEDRERRSSTRSL